MVGLTYLSITGSRNTAERVRDLVWSYMAWMGVMEMEDDTPGLTVWPKFIATCTGVARKQRVVACGEVSRTNIKLSI
jgi:hypothetical protein